MMIRRVGNLQLGDEIIYRRVRGKIESFPTRYSVVLKAIKPISGKWSWAKISVKEIQTL